MERPMPVVPPVIAAVLPFKSFGMEDFKDEVVMMRSSTVEYFSKKRIKKKKKKPHNRNECSTL